MPNPFSQPTKSAGSRRKSFDKEPGRYGSRSVVIAFLERAGQLAQFTARFFREVWRPPYETRELICQMDEVGSKSFLIVFITGLSIGIVMSMQSRGTLTYFGAEAMLPDMVALAVIKEFGPVITAIVLAGRLGAGFVAEVGSMRVTEQIDAMEVAALKPFNYLVNTRVVACVLMFPLLTVITDTVGLAGAYLEATFTTGTDFRIFLADAFRTIRYVDIIVDTFKTCIFGLIVGLVSCSYGYEVKGGAREVGQAAMQSVVLSTLLVVMADVVIVRMSIWMFGDVSS